MIEFMNIKIAENGYIVEHNLACFVFSNLSELLYFIKDEFQPGSRYDEKRVYIIEAPGDKNDGFTNCHANTLWPDLAEYPCPTCSCKGNCNEE